MGSMPWTFMPQEIRTILGDDYESFIKDRERHGIITNVPQTTPGHRRIPSNPSANSNENVKISVDGSSRSSSASRLSSPGSHNSSSAQGQNSSSNKE